MKLRQALIVALGVTTLASLVAAKILWATTAWYEWIALAVCAACMLGLKLLTMGGKPEDGGSSRSADAEN